MPRIVVLGTGTGVGKTYFTVALARALAARPATSVLAVKPVETGFHAGQRRAATSDAERLRRASSAAVRAEGPLYAFRDPVSAHLAARRAKRPVSPNKIRDWIEALEDNATAVHDTTLHWSLVETAGGALSPLTPTVSNAELALALEPAIWILVAPDALGVLHDVRATLLALRHHAREPDFIVLSAARAKDASTGTNAAELSRLRIAEPIASLSRRANPRRALARLVSALDDRARPQRGSGANHRRSR
jgi:dethiobiotin synthetase